MHKNKVLVTGANGLLGQKVVRTLSNEFEVLATGRKPASLLPDIDYKPCDITSRSDIRQLIFTFKPNVIVNAAAYTDVDGCEDDRENCWKTNVHAIEHIAQAARSTNAFVIHISTDYVFDGISGEFSEDSRPNPLSYYGRAKLAGENALIATGIDCAIIRTMILYGTGNDLRLNFATWLVEKLSRHEPVKIVDDQFGHPTLVDDVARAVDVVARETRTGIFHVCGADYVSRYEFALKLADVFGLDRNLISRVKTETLSQKAVRPLNSRFNLERTRTELGIEPGGIVSGLTTLKEQMGFGAD